MTLSEIAVLTSRDLTGDSTRELERLRDVDTRSLLELHEPLATLDSPDVEVVNMLQLELVSLFLSSLEGLKIVRELDLLVEGLLVGIISSEVLWFENKALEGMLSFQE